MYRGQQHYLYMLPSVLFDIITSYYHKIYINIPNCHALTMVIIIRFDYPYVTLKQDIYKRKQKTKKEKSLMPTAPSVPRRSPIQVLTGLNIAWLQWSDENWYVQCDMAVGENYSDFKNICSHDFIVNDFNSKTHLSNSFYLF